MLARSSLVSSSLLGLAGNWRECYLVPNTLPDVGGCVGLASVVGIPHQISSFPNLQGWECVLKDPLLSHVAAYTFMVFLFPASALDQTLPNH